MRDDVLKRVPFNIWACWGFLYLTASQKQSYRLDRRYKPTAAIARANCMLLLSKLQEIQPLKDDDGVVFSAAVEIFGWSGGRYLFIYMFFIPLSLLSYLGG